MNKQINTTDWEINDLDLVEHQETTDYIKDTGTGIYAWEGTLHTDRGDFKFRYEETWTEDNGGDTGHILSDKPQEMSNDEWEEFIYIMVSYLEEQYTENKQEWRESEW